MARTNDNSAISTIANEDILAITDINDATLDKKITMAQIKTFSATDITGKQDLITAPTNNNLVTTNAFGQTKDSGIASTVLTTQGNTFNGNSQLVQTTVAGKYPALDGSFIVDVGTKNITQIATCVTASVTAEKAVTLSGFVLATGATIQVTFTNANTTTTPTLNVNSTGAKAIYNEAGTAVSATNPAYFPAGSTVEFTYNGTNWIFKKRVVENYVNGASWYRVHSDGWIEQGGKTGIISTAPSPGVLVNFIKTFSNTNYVLKFSITGERITSSEQPAINPVSISQFGISTFLEGRIYYWTASGY